MTLVTTLRCILILAIWLGSARAFGQDDAVPATPAPREVELQYTVAPGAEGCPDGEFFKTMVRSDVGFDPFVSGAHARLIVTIAPAGHGLVHGYAELRDHLGTIHLLRYAAPEECRYLASVLVVAIGIRMRASKPRVPMAEPTAESPPLSTDSEPLSPATDQRPPLAEPPPPAQATARTSSSTPRRPKGATIRRVMNPAPGTSFRVGVEAGASVVFWVRHLHVAGQVLLGGALRWGKASLTLSGQFEPQIVASERETPVLTLSRLSASVAPCIHLRAFYACPVGELGAMFVANFASGLDAFTGISALIGAQGGVELVPHDYVVLRLFARGAAAIARPAIAVRDRAPLWIAPAGSISLGATIVTLF